MKKAIYIFSLLMPWELRRRILCSLLHFEIHSTCRIGISWVLPQHLLMEPFARIGHFSVCKGLETMHLAQHATIGNGNWITGYPRGHPMTFAEPSHFAHQPERRPELLVGEHGAITNRHIIDCTTSVHIGKFATIAGFGSQILTHSISLEEGRQTSAPVTIGEYCFVGTNVVVLSGSTLPAYSVLGAKALLNKSYSETYHLYGGVPARPLRELGEDLAYFRRTTGFVI